MFELDISHRDLVCLLGNLGSPRSAPVSVLRPLFIVYESSLRRGPDGLGSLDYTSLTLPSHFTEAEIYLALSFSLLFSLLSLHLCLLDISYPSRHHDSV